MTHILKHEMMKKLKGPRGGQSTPIKILHLLH